MKDVIYTIGHSNHSPEVLLKLLTDAKIEVLVDVRSHPGSQWVLHANSRALKRILRSAGIQYLYMGDMLGGHPTDPDCYDPQTGKPNYEVMQNKESFQQGLSMLMEGLKKYRICVMCAEEDPSLCHRNLLVGEGLRRRGVQVLHIRGDGRIQTDEELWKEKARVGISQLPLPLGDNQ
jgi:uncharacterized protein (DUF488 family)